MCVCRSSATAGSEGKVLIHLSKTEISGMLDDPMIYVVFTLLYDIAEATHAAARRVRSHLCCVPLLVDFVCSLLLQGLIDIIHWIKM